MAVSREAAMLARIEALEARLEGGREQQNSPRVGGRYLDGDFDIELDVTKK